ncbi:MAG: ROK family protein [Pelolinea sp.]|nr:ROK family protein [Pelolinea sp.]
MAQKIFGAVELGGTKITAIVAKDLKTVLDKKVFPTLSPKETLNDIIEFFKSALNREIYEYQAIGVGSFGPLDLNPESRTYGYITSTPKQGWQFFNIKQEIESALQTRVYLETDVNASALGEFFLYPENRIQNLVYITIGTGIGAGIIINGKIVHGLVHPELGHIRIPHDYRQDPFPGICPFHRDCFEGLASGPAMEERWHQPPEKIPTDHIAWELEAEYIAYAIANLICTISPEIIVLGGGVMQRHQLLKMVQSKTRCVLSGYIKSKSLEDNISEYIVPPRLKEDSGILGALSMAIHESKSKS